MIRALTIVSLLLAATVAAADPRSVVRSADAKPAPAKATCKRTLVGRGPVHRVVCELDATIVVKQGAPKPHVLIVDHGGRAVVGRPRSEDRLAGLSHRLNQND